MKKSNIIILIVIGVIIVLGFFLFNNDSNNEVNNPGDTNEGEANNEEGASNVEDSVTSDVFVVENTNGTDGGFDKLIELMASEDLNFYNTDSSPNGLIKKDDVIIIKTNCQWDQRGGTNTDLIKSIINSLVNHPDGFEGEIIVADNGHAQYGPKRNGGSMDWENNNAQDLGQSAQKVVDSFSDKYKVSTSLWDDFTRTEVNEFSGGDYEDGFILSEEEDIDTGLIVSYPKFTTKYGTYVSFKHGIWDKELEQYDSEKLKVINVPVLKSHLVYNVTASVKNYMGTTSDFLTRRNAHFSIGVGGMGTQMAETRMPVLNVLDAIYINPYPLRGPETPYSSGVENNTILASIDPVALDYWAAKNILIPKAKEVGGTNYEDMSPDSTKAESFGYWLRASMEEIRKIGYPTTMNEKNINVYKYEN